MIVSPRTHTHTLSVLYTFKGLSIRPQVRLSFTYIQILVLYQRVSHAMASIRLQIDIMVDIILTAAHCGWQTQTTTLYTAYAARQYAPASAPTRPSPALGRSNFSSQTRNPLLRLHDSRHLKKPIGFPNLLHSGRSATAHDNAIGGLIDDFEMVRDQGSFVIFRSAQFLGGPEVCGRFGALVFSR